MPVRKEVILSTAYLPNIHYFSKLISASQITIEIHENYQKQSYRNRTMILGANGPLCLVIPVKKPDGNHTKITDVIIDHEEPWQHRHWKAIRSAYRHSPFFNIFEDELKELYNKKINFLIDWNFLLLDRIIDMTGNEIHYKKSTSYIQDYESILDYRNTIHPKKRMQKADHKFSPIPYYQVFIDKFGFVPDLSFIDLLFNEGPEAVQICRKCINPDSASGSE